MKTPIREYKMVSHTDKTAFNYEVNTYLKEGWELKGQLAITGYGAASVRFAQVMILPDIPPEPEAITPCTDWIEERPS